MEKFKVFLTDAFIASILFFLVISEIAFQFNNAKQKTMQTLLDSERAELDSVLTHPSMIAEKHKAEASERSLRSAAAYYDSGNGLGFKRAKESGKKFIPYSASVGKTIDDINKAWEPYFTQKERFEAPIRVYYAARRQEAAGWLSNLSGVQFGVVPSMAAVFLAFLSTRWRDDKYFWMIVLAAVAAQAMASVIIYDGAVLRFGDHFKAVGISLMYFLVVPVAFHFGIRTMGTKAKLEPVNEETEVVDVKPIVIAKNGHSNGTNGHTKRIVTVNVWEEIPVPDEVDKGKSFIRLLVLLKQYNDGDMKRLAAEMSRVSGREIKATNFKRSYDAARRERRGDFESVRNAINELVTELKSVPILSDFIGNRNRAGDD